MVSRRSVWQQGARSRRFKAVGAVPDVSGQSPLFVEQAIARVGRDQHSAGAGSARDSRGRLQSAAAILRTRPARSTVGKILVTSLVLCLSSVGLSSSAGAPSAETADRGGACPTPAGKIPAVGMATCTSAAAALCVRMC